VLLCQLFLKLLDPPLTFIDYGIFYTKGCLENAQLVQRGEKRKRNKERRNVEEIPRRSSRRK
jgi:hypothetical protein